MRRGGYLVLAALALSFATPGAAEQTFNERYAEFELFANCEPMDLIVEGLGSDATEIGLTEEKIQAAVESRLRSARLYDSNAYPYLYVNVNVIGIAFNISVEYKKIVIDSASGHEFPATTWTTGSTGTNGRESSYILSSISEHLDRFLVEFLRVNEEACEKR